MVVRERKKRRGTGHQKFRCRVFRAAACRAYHITRNPLHLTNNDPTELVCNIEALYKPDTFKHLTKRRRDLNIHSSFRQRERGIKYSIYQQGKQPLGL